MILRRVNLRPWGGLSKFRRFGMGQSSSSASASSECTPLRLCISGGSVTDTFA
jgi:hypothetical protein